MKYSIILSGVTIGPNRSIFLCGKSTSSFSTCCLRCDTWNVEYHEAGGGKASLYVDDSGNASSTSYGLSQRGMNLATLLLGFCMYSCLQCVVFIITFSPTAN